MPLNQLIWEVYNLAKVKITSSSRKEIFPFKKQKKSKEPEFESAKF